MKRGLIFALAFVMVAAGGARSEPASTTNNERTRPRLADSEVLLELDRRLKLTETQQEQLMRMKEAFQTKHADELRRLRDEVRRVRASLDEARANKDRAALLKAKAEVRELRAEGEKLRHEFETQLLTILTSEQKAKYEKLKKDGIRRKPTTAATP